MSGLDPKFVIQTLIGSSSEIEIRSCTHVSRSLSLSLSLCPSPRNLSRTHRPIASAADPLPFSRAKLSLHFKKPLSIISVEDLRLAAGIVEMTEYWVSQGNKWCDFCKIYIANNPLSIRTHEIGQRHKDNVAKKLASMRKEGAAKEKEQKEAAKALEQIEEKAKRSYQKDLTSFRDSHVSESHGKNQSDSKLWGAPGPGWEFDAASGYYYDLTKGYYYDPKSCLYYSNNIGKWVSKEEAFPPSQISKPATDGATSKSKAGTAPGLVVSTPLNPKRSVKGAPSSIAVNKRKREDAKTKVVSKEEEAALKAREAARKRVEEREKPLLGLYRSY